MTRSHRLMILTVTAINFCMIFFDMSGVAVALPTIQRELLCSTESLSWVMTAYLLGLTATVVLAGRLADMFGHRRFLIIGLVIFLLASIICAITPNVGWLLAGRALEGVGGAILLALSPALIMNSFDKDAQGKAMGLVVAFASSFLAAGPFLAGILSEWLSWRLIFWINFCLSYRSLISVLSNCCFKLSLSFSRLDFSFGGPLDKVFKRFFCSAIFI